MSERVDMPAPSSAPATVEQDLPCPLCEYDLRGLTECRCPECGYTFNWDELRDPKRRRHPYLFEHHPERNFWSAARTFLGGLRPHRFWSGVFPTQPSRPKRLIAYGLLCNGLYAGIVTAILTAVLILEIEKERVRLRQEVYNAPVQAKMRLIQNFGSLDAAWQACVKPELLPCLRDAFTLPDGPYVLLTFIAVPVAWPWLTFLSLLVYQRSMRRSHVRAAHLLRVSIYSYDVIVATGLAAAFMAMTEDCIRIRWSRLRPWGEVFQLDGILITAYLVPILAMLLLFCSFRLWVACRKYLQFRFALAAVIASQTIVLLAASCLVFTTDLFFEHVPGTIYLTLHRVLHVSALLGSD
jgi:hypothetical protein